MHVCVTSTMFRLEWRSASDPPRIERNSIGAEAAAATAPSNNLEPVNW